MTILKIHEQSLLLQYEFVDLNNLLGLLQSDMKTLITALVGICSYEEAGYDVTLNTNKRRQLWQQQ